MSDFYVRLAKLRDQWLSRLEADAEKLQPAYELDDERFEWSEWRLALVQCIAIAEAMLLEANRPDGNTVHRSFKDAFEAIRRRKEPVATPGDWGPPE